MKELEEQSLLMHVLMIFLDGLSLTATVTEAKSLGKV